MSINLNQNEAEIIKKKFYNLQNDEDLLDLLNYAKPLYYDSFAIKPYKLATLKLYYQKNPTINKYTSFFVQKKNGSSRLIQAPVKPLKSILKVLNYIFQYVLEPHPSALGFVKNKSIVDNAVFHLRKKYVYNIDLTDFFHSFGFDQVKKLFSSPPYNFNDKRENVASIISTLCTNTFQLNNTPVSVLPQGSPTSPTLSNILSYQLDKQLTQLAADYRACYTRYADDITFSSNYPIFNDPVFINKLHTIIVFEAGFKINSKKTRLQKNTSRQEVTGLIVNEKINVKKKYTKEIRMWLYFWEKYGYDKAQQIFIKDTLQKKFVTKYPSLLNVVDGKLNFLKMVKGQDDFSYIKLKNRYIALVNKYFLNNRPMEKQSDNKKIIVAHDELFREIKSDNTSLQQPKKKRRVVTEEEILKNIYGEGEDDLLMAPVRVSDKYEDYINSVAEAIKNELDSGKSLNIDTFIGGAIDHLTPQETAKRFNLLVEAWSRATGEKYTDTQKKDLFDNFFGSDALREALSSTKVLKESAEEKAGKAAAVESEIFEENSDQEDTETEAEEVEEIVDVEFKDKKIKQPGVKISYHSQKYKIVDEQGNKMTDAENDEVLEKAGPLLSFDHFQEGDKVKIEFDWEYMRNPENTILIYDDEGNATVKKIKEFVEENLGMSYDLFLEKSLIPEEAQKMLLASDILSDNMPTVISTEVDGEWKKVEAGIDTVNWWNPKNVSMPYDKETGEPLPHIQRQIINKAKQYNRELRDVMKKQGSTTVLITRRRTGGITTIFEDYKNEENKKKFEEEKKKLEEKFIVELAKLPEDDPSAEKRLRDRFNEKFKELKNKIFNPFHSIFDAFKGNTEEFHKRAVIGQFYGDIAPVSDFSGGELIINGKEVRDMDIENLEEFKKEQLVKALKKGASGLAGMTVLVYQVGKNTYRIAALDPMHPGMQEEAKRIEGLLDELERLAKIYNRELEPDYEGQEIELRKLNTAFMKMGFSGFSKNSVNAMRNRYPKRNKYKKNKYFMDIDRRKRGGTSIDLTQYRSVDEILEDAKERKVKTIDNETLLTKFYHTHIEFNEAKDINGEPFMTAAVHPNIELSKPTGEPAVEVSFNAKKHIVDKIKSLQEIAETEEEKESLEETKERALKAIEEKEKAAGIVVSKKVKKVK
jgi:hypothetical protein